LSPFLRQLQDFIDARRSAGEDVALLHVDCGVVADLDASWGVGVGDAAHGFFAAQLRSEALREQDFIASAGRDAFACALVAVGDPGVAMLAAEKLLRALDTPLWVGEDEIYASPAIGIAIPAGRAADASTLLGQAITACRLARELPSRAALFCPGPGQAGERLSAQSRLRAAAVQGSLEFRFRPQFDLRTGLVVGAEGAFGWSGGVVRVREAIAAARAARRVNEVTRWAVSALLRECTELRQGCGLDLRVAINLSARDLHLSELAESILGLMKVWNLRPSRLLLGISDASALVHGTEAHELLLALGKAGVRLGLDDPAAGLATLAQLDALPFAELRLDVAALGDLAGSVRSQGIARALIEMAHQSRMEVLGDGVVDAATSACLKDLGCDIVQGEHVGPFVDTQGFIGAWQQ